MGSRLDSALPLSRAWTIASFLDVEVGSVPYSSSRPADASVGRRSVVAVVIRVVVRRARRLVLVLGALLSGAAAPSSVVVRREQDVWELLMEKAEELPLLMARANATDAILIVAMCK